MSKRFYINCPLSPGLVTLDGPEAHHLATVSRLRVGEAVILFNGDGGEYPGHVAEVGKRQVTLELADRVTPERELSIHLEVAAPLPKGDRMQFLIEKLTELGVTRFVPLLCERSFANPREGKVEKLERYVIEASKQCGRNRLMEISEPVRWTDYVLPRENELRVLAHPDGMGNGLGASNALRCAVGPEGGFTDGEIALGSANGWQLVTFGPRILRIETAAIALAARLTV